MSTQRFEGRSAAEAAIKACETLGVTRPELKYTVVSETGELLTRKVVIEVEVSAHASASRPPSESSDDAPRRPRREPRGRGRGQPSSERSNNQDTDEAADARAAEALERYDEQRERRPRSEGEGGGSRRGRRGGRNGQGNNAQRQDAPREPRGEQQARAPRAPRPPRPSQADNGVDNLLKLIPAPPSVPRQEAIVPSGPRAKRAVEVCSRLIELMGLTVDTHLVEEGADELQVHLHGKDEERFIGKKGEVLLALQFIINRMLSRSEDEGEQLLTLDAGGFRQRRRVALENLARTLAERAVAERKAVRLSPMSAHDRRVFHLALKEVSTVTTRSEGDGMFRNLLIIPAEFVA